MNDYEEFTLTRVCDKLAYYTLYSDLDTTSLESTLESLIMIDADLDRINYIISKIERMKYIIKDSTNKRDLAIIHLALLKRA